MDGLRTKFAQYHGHDVDQVKLLVTLTARGIPISIYMHIRLRDKLKGGKQYFLIAMEYPGTFSVQLRPWQYRSLSLVKF